MGDKGKKELEKELVSLRADYERVMEANSTLNQRLIELYTLYNVSKTLSMSLQLNELFDTAMNIIGEALSVNRYFLMLLDEDARRLVVRAIHGMPDDAMMEGVVMVGEGACGKVAESGEPVLVPDISKEKGFFCFPNCPIHEGSFLGVPLKGHNNGLLGVLTALKRKPDGFGEREIRLFNAVAEHVGIAVENAIAFQHSQELMSRDELTNLYNRRYFFERFEREIYRAERYERSLSLIMIDIDHFKIMNDSFGHLRGDQALRRMSRILETNLRKADVLARYGGEEFLLMLPETGKKAAAVVGEKLRQAVESTDFNQDAPGLEPARLTVTVGVASYPEDSKEPLELLDLADKALYFGKAQGRNQVCTEVPKATGKGAS